MLNPGMKSRGYYEWARQKAEALNEQHKPEPPKPTRHVGDVLGLDQPHQMRRRELSHPRIARFGAGRAPGRSLSQTGRSR